jgi:flavin-binding protein dodecin
MTRDTPVTGTSLEEEQRMSNHTYRVTEIVGTSPDGVDQAIRNGIDRASQTLRNLDWFEVTQVRGQLEEGRIAHWQVGLKVGFRLDESE